VATRPGRKQAIELKKTVLVPFAKPRKIVGRPYIIRGRLKRGGS